MPVIINPAAIFVPMLLVVALTFAGFVNLAIKRTRSASPGGDMSFYRAHQGPPEPEATAAASRHYGNLLELPVLLYAACLTAFALGEVSRTMLVFAWGYAIARTVQSVIHMSYNNPAHRGGAFMLGVLFMLLLWIDVAWVIFTML